MIKIQLDYLQGPIWISDVQTGKPMTGIDVIDNDSILVPWNLECSDLFSSCYEFNTHNMACWFDKELEKKNSARMLSLIEQIKNRLNEINDGSFVVENLKTERLKNL
ncbi:hypothetical protein [Fibrobacter intestinalis]|nr:hypothetical protein [Fibrobacter intestinalis]